MTAPVEVVQLTLAPKEAVWLYSAMRVGHLVSVGRAAFLAGNQKRYESASRAARDQMPDLMRAVSLLEPGTITAVMEQLERLIKASPMAGQVLFTEDGS